MLIARIPPGREAERRYILDVVLGGFLGISYEIIIDPLAREWCFECGDNNRIVLPDVMLASSHSDWLKSNSLPVEPLRQWDTKSSVLGYRLWHRLVFPIVPILYGEASPSSDLVRFDSRGLTAKLDVMGSIFFMLTCYEETVRQVRDRHGRFPGRASLATRESFFDRPIVDEYVEILWALLKRLWPGLRRRERAFIMRPTHDVDEALRYPNARRLWRRAAGHVLRGRPSGLAQTWREWRGIRRNGAWADPWFTFRDIMDLSENAGATSTFYFLTDRHGTPRNSTQPFDTPAIRVLLREIADRGHVIGLHPSYDTWRDGAQMRRELDILQRVCREEGIVQESWSVRQHYLRLESPGTWRLWDDSGFDTDSSLMYADRAGFRCGTCHGFPLFDLEEGRELAVREQPLIVMECSVLDDRYMGLGRNPDAALAAMLELKRRCAKFGGEFVLLWHNHRLEKPGERELYRQIMSAS